MKCRQCSGLLDIEDYHQCVNISCDYSFQWKQCQREHRYYLFLYHYCCQLFGYSMSHVSFKQTIHPNWNSFKPSLISLQVSSPSFQLAFCQSSYLVLVLLSADYE